MTTAELSADEQQEVRDLCVEMTSNFITTVMYWTDILRHTNQSIVLKYWPTWCDNLHGGAALSLPVVAPIAPKVSDVVSSSEFHVFGGIHFGVENFESMDDLKHNIVDIFPDDPPIDDAVILLEERRSSDLASRFIVENHERWQRARRVLESPRSPPPELELLFLCCTEEGELDIGIRNISDDDCVVDRVTVTVVKDCDYVASMFEPSAYYKLSVADLRVGDSRSIDVRQLVAAHRADRFLIDLDDMRSLHLHVSLRVNATRELSGLVWLFGEDD